MIVFVALMPLTRYSLKSPRGGCKSPLVQDTALLSFSCHEALISFLPGIAIASAYENLAYRYTDQV